MTFKFRPAQRSSAKPLIGLYAESNRGKTYSSLLLARGFVGPTGRIGMIETEAGRGEAYADLIPGSYEVMPLRENFSPKNYGDAIAAAEREKVDACIIDSASHEWEGIGGVLDMAAENQAKHKKGPLVWQQPKIDHQRYFMGRLLQSPIPLIIVCMRAKYPMAEIKKPDGSKEWVRSTILEPKQSDDILFEMFFHGWLDEQHRLHVTRFGHEGLRTVLIDDEPITLQTGERLAAFARGEAAPAAEPTQITIQPGANGPDWTAWSKAAANAVRSAPTAAWLGAWINLHAAALANLKADQPRWAEKLQTEIDGRLHELTKRSAA